MKTTMHATRQQWVKWAAVSLIGLSVFATTAWAEDLRIMAFQGTVPEKHLEQFKQLIKQKYQVDLNIIIIYETTPDELLKPLKNGEVDIISCPHNIPNDPRFKLISGKLTIPVDLNNIPNYQHLIPALQKAEYITEEGEVYGVPYIYAEYGLAYNTNLLAEAPTTWNVFWDSQYAQKYSISSNYYELNIFIAALAAGIPKDQIGNYDAISTPEFQAKVTALAKNAKTLWVGIESAKDLQGLAVATAYGFAFNDLKTQGEIWKFAEPKEGTTCGVGNFMLSHTLRENPQLKRIAEEWLNYVISPEYQIDVVVRTTSSFPTSLAIKDQLTPEEASAYHLDNPNYFQDHLILWPLLDKRTRTGFELLWQKATR